MSISCSKCGAQNDSQARFCMSCGSPISASPVSLSTHELRDNYGQVYTLSGPVYKIGSNPGSNIVLNEPDVPPTAVELWYQEGTWVLKDSSGVISINGQTIQGDKVLSDGVSFQVGTTVFRYTNLQQVQPSYIPLPSAPPADFSGFRSTGQSPMTDPAGNLINPSVPVGQKLCSACRRPIYAVTEICPYCGVRQISAYAAPGIPTGKHSRSSAGILALLLGGIGAHKFYLGQTGSGVLYLLFSWTVIPLIVGIIEGITYLTMTDEAFTQKYG